MFNEETKKVLDSLKLHSFIEELELLEAANKAPAQEVHKEDNEGDELVLLPRMKKKKPLPLKKYFLCFLVALTGVGAGIWLTQDETLPQAPENELIAQGEQIAVKDAYSTIQDIDHQYLLEILEERSLALKRVLYCLQKVVVMTHDSNQIYDDLTHAVDEFREVNRCYLELLDH